MNYGDGETWDNLTAKAKAHLIGADPMLRDAIAEEREACAKLAEQMAGEYAAAYGWQEEAQTAKNVADRIRERGNQ